MIRSVEGLTGTALENWFQELFINHLKLEYYPSNGQISLADIDPSQRPGHHLEIDGVLLINKTCIFLEYTGQGDDFKAKIKKFVRNCHLFMNSFYLTAKEKFKLFGISSRRLARFEEVDSYKFVYFGTHNSFEPINLTRQDFPDFPHIQQNLFLFKPTHIEYLRQLVGLINIHAKHEFFATLGFKPSDLDDAQSSLHLKYLKAFGKNVTSNQNIKADIYLLKFRIDELLQICRVSRYEGIPFLLDEDKKTNYQRFLIDNKLKNISNEFIRNSSSASFPNTITLVLPSDCIEETKAGSQVLTIQKNYASIDIIDGQHRLFAYTNPRISNITRRDAEILASGIKFRQTTPALITRNSAKVFCEINANQAKVKNNLLYLIKFDVLGDTDEIALAGKIILDCNKGTSVLSDIFLTNSLRKKNRLNLPAVPITTIVDSDLVPFIKGLKPNGQLVNDTVYSNVFGHARVYFKRRPSTLITSAKPILEGYFNITKKVFSEDWTLNASTHLISSKYISAFIRLLREKLFVEKASWAKIEGDLKSLKSKIDLTTGANNCPSFSKGFDLVPSTKLGISTIFDFLKNPSSFPPP